MNAQVQPSLFLPLIAAEHIAQCRALLAESAKPHTLREELARKVALAELIEARDE